MQIWSLTFLAVTTAGQVSLKGNSLTIVQEPTWRKTMQIGTKFIAERRFFSLTSYVCQLSSWSGRSLRITIAQCNIRPSEHSDYELSVTTKRCVLKGLKVNIGDWLVSQTLLLF